MTQTQLPDDGIITLVPWTDALAEAQGHPVRGDYVEHFWLGILGPPRPGCFDGAPCSRSNHPKGQLPT